VTSTSPTLKPTFIQMTRTCTAVFGSQHQQRWGTTYQNSYAHPSLHRRSLLGTRPQFLGNALQQCSDALGIFQIRNTCTAHPADRVDRSVVHFLAPVCTLWPPLADGHHNASDKCFDTGSVRSLILSELQPEKESTQ
jgi:hypothetical protein